MNGFKGTQGQSNNFSWKWYFLIIKQNISDQEIQKVTFKPQLACCACPFAVLTSLASNFKLNNFITSWKLIKTPQNFVQGSFSVNVTKYGIKTWVKFWPPVWHPLMRYKLEAKKKPDITIFQTLSSLSI